MITITNTITLIIIFKNYYVLPDPEFLTSQNKLSRY